MSKWTNFEKIAALVAVVVLLAGVGWYVWQQTSITGAFTLPSGGSVSVTVDSSSPLPGLLVADTPDDKWLAVFRLAARGEAQNLRMFRITNDGAKNTIRTYMFYSDRDGHGNRVNPFLIGIVPGGQVGTLCVPPGMVKIPENDFVRITVGIILMPVDGYVVENDALLQLTVENPSRDVQTEGTMSGDAIYGDLSGSQDASRHYVFKSIPIANLAPSSPSGNLIVSASTPIAVFGLAADLAGDITFIKKTPPDSANIQDNYIIFNLSYYLNDVSQENTGEALIKFLNKSDGTVLGSALVTLKPGSDYVTSAALVFDLNSLRLPAGAYRNVEVRMNTIQFEDPGDWVLVWLQEKNENIGWGIAGNGNYQHGDILFRGDIYAHKLVKAQ